MPYRHYGNIGDVWKHLPLCEILAIEQPGTYVETNAAYAAYDLEGTARQAYGIGHVYTNGGKVAAIRDSRYLRTLRTVNGDAAMPRIYLGSPALAMHTLRDSTARFVFFDLEAPALANDVAYAGSLDLSGRVETVLGDSIAGSLRLLVDLDEGAFLHIDPYTIFEENTSGQAFLDVFLSAARRGLRCMLWAGYSTGSERATTIARIRDAVGSDPSIDGEALFGVDIASAMLRPDTIIANPGIVGCMVLTAHLSEAAREAMTVLSRGLVALYQDGITFEGHSGRLEASEVRFPA